MPADAQQRTARCRQDDVRRREQDRELVERMTQAVLALFPGCPLEEARAIATRTAARGSGRVGRTSAGRALEAEALTAAVVAAIRYNHTLRPATHAGVKPVRCPEHCSRRC